MIDLREMRSSANTRTRSKNLIWKTIYLMVAYVMPSMLGIPERPQYVKLRLMSYVVDVSNTCKSLPVAKKKKQVGWQFGREGQNVLRIMV